MAARGLPYISLPAWLVHWPTPYWSGRLILAWAAASLGLLTVSIAIVSELAMAMVVKNGRLPGLWEGCVLSVALASVATGPGIEEFSNETGILFLATSSWPCVIWCVFRPGQSMGWVNSTLVLALIIPFMSLQLWFSYFSDDMLGNAAPFLTIGRVVNAIVSGALSGYLSVRIVQRRWRAPLVALAVFTGGALGLAFGYGSPYFVQSGLWWTAVALCAAIVWAFVGEALPDCRFDLIEELEGMRRRD